ncbi:heme lyase NrfEFG subunit NrfF [Vibrio sp. SCSIO 43135]|uniref:heme lyase NrfEFG subunit NrfF n=1 Tax=Vibrio sp. SCSIO 43135 TaxID=2819096 RepID=UPI0020758081|nr:heme lyase NrfEFG subunit NrfF [Vibrio sp. SCSIO 43135]USD40397.1 heme lyase NrfEFG subunit NrfF [Vibrio sp. SCSIO 43135]
MIQSVKLLCVIVAMMVSCTVVASEPDLFAPASKEVTQQVELFEFDTPQLQKRAIELAKTLRCPQCQNQNLVESNSPIAKDLRLIVFNKVNEGETDQQVIDYMTARYGEFVLYKPTFSAQNALLWGLPMLALLAFFFLSWRKINSRHA